ncbi:hypothetical protein BC829DRAFT_416698 [Chytridium lagenaria]|nr:hypothetical protein BC829DRAFT_416698 [Chytridium lagenaria]
MSLKSIVRRRTREKKSRDKMGQQRRPKQWIIRPDDPDLASGLQKLIEQGFQDGYGFECIYVNLNGCILVETTPKRDRLITVFNKVWEQGVIVQLLPNEKSKTSLREKTHLQKKNFQESITDDERIELDGIAELLVYARASVRRYDTYIKLAIKEPPRSKSFSEADSEWIQAVTGVNTSYRKWTGYVIDETVHPEPEFKTAFERVGKAFHQHNEAGRRIFLNLFLSDIILRPEFNEKLRIFPELDVTVETNGPKKRKLYGRTDYTVGFGKGKDMFDNAIPREVHLVAVEAKTSIGEQDLWQCVAEAASLYKIRVDAGKANKRVWGILSNAKQWQFVLIDEVGFLWQSEDFIMDLRSYDESKVLQVYRIVHYIVRCCHEACTPPPSAASSVVSLNE